MGSTVKAMTDELAVELDKQKIEELKMEIQGIKLAQDRKNADAVNKRL